MIHPRNAVAAAAACLLAVMYTPAMASAQEPIPTPAALPTQSPSPAESPTMDAPTAAESPAPQTSTPTPTPTATESPVPTLAPTPSTTPTRTETPTAAITPAAIGWAYLLGTDSLCPGSLDPAVTNVGGAVSVDLAKVGTYSWLAFDATAASSCLNSITSLDIVGTNADVTGITIAQGTFAQTSGAANTLTSVSFPTGIETIDISQGAFAQYSTVGSNTLAQVTFPSTGLTSLYIDERAFRQETTAPGADNALAAVALAADRVTLADSAFAQVSAAGDNALKTVTLSSTESTVILSRVFQQQAGGNNALTGVTLPAANPQLQIGESAFAQEAGGNNTLASVTIPDSVAQLSVYDYAFTQQAGGHNALTSLSFPETMTYLETGVDSFAQTVTGTGDTALTSVVFPTTVEMLNLGVGTFAQTAAQGNATLRTVTFPTSAPAGTGIGDRSFAQTAPSGSTALTRVRFPASTDYLVLGDDAFAQNATTNTLTTVLFPATVLGLYVGKGALSQTGTPVLASITFPFSAAPSLGTYFDATAVPATATIDWIWFGRDKVTIQDWPVFEPKSLRQSSPSAVLAAASIILPHGRPLSTELTGYRTLTLANQASTKTSFVYRDGQIVTTPLSGQGTTIGAANAGGGWTITLPAATSPLGSFGGWCTSAISGTGICAGSTLAAGSAYTLKGNTQLWASWRSAAIVPPVIPAQTLGGAAVGQAYRQVITIEGSGDINCTITAGQLPPGLSLNGCTISGTPTVAGSYAFTVSATNSAGSTDRDFTLSIAGEQLAATGTDGLLPLLSLASLLILGGLVLRRRPFTS